MQNTICVVRKKALRTQKQFMDSSFFSKPVSARRCSGESFNCTSKELSLAYNGVSFGIKKKSGFTLIEMLTVVGIILLLILLLIPSLTNALESSYLATCGNNLKQVGHMSAMYSEDNYGYIVECVCYKRLAPYGMDAMLRQSGESYQWFTCPRQYSRFQGFDQNMYIGIQYFQKYHVNATNYMNRFIKMDQLPKPSKMIFMTPSNYTGVLYWGFGIVAGQPTHHFAGQWAQAQYGDMNARGGVGMYGEENILFFDGHAKPYWWDDPEMAVFKTEFNPNTW